MELHKKDMFKLEKAFFENLQRDNTNNGGIGIDSKRPFGNSDVESDILEYVLNVEPEGNEEDNEGWSSKQREYAAAMYDGLIEWLQSKYL